MSADEPSPADATPSARLHDARFAYRDQRVVLTIERLALPERGLVALVGPNGCGKSTLLLALAGLLEPLTGQVEVLDTAPPPQQRIATVFQQHHADEALPLTVGEVVQMGRFAERGLLRRLRQPDRDAVEEAMDRLAIADLRRRQMAELSGGQRQRALVAQALAQRADLLLLDEPLTGLDAPSRDRIHQVLEAERSAKPVVMATHDLDEARSADQVVLLSGQVIAAGPPDEALTPDCLLTAYGGLAAAEFDEHRDDAQAPSGPPA